MKTQTTKLQNRARKASLAAALCLIAAHSFGEIIQYQFTTAADPDALLMLGIVPGGESNIVSGTFYYDNAATTNGVIQPMPNGNAVVFDSAVLNANLTFDSTSFSSLQLADGDAWVFDNTFSYPPTVTNFDGMNLVLWHNATGTGAHTVGSYVLEGITLNFFGPQFLSLPNLPQNLAALGLGVTPSASLYFRDEMNQRISLNLLPVTITEVPAPASVWLFGSALLMLRRKAR